MNDDDEDYNICKDAVAKWYRLWIQWHRGLYERQLLVEEFKSLIVDDTTTFVWVDGRNGRVWQDLQFLHDPIMTTTTTAISSDVEEEDDDSGDTTTTISLLV
jgi:hypothetical protein